MISGRHLDVLTWVGDGYVHSTAPSNDAPVRLRRPGATSRCITGMLAPVAHAALVERTPDGTKWRLTDDGQAVLNGAAVWLLVDEAAMGDSHGRRGTDWWNDYYRSSAAVTRDSDGTVRIRCASRNHAQRWADLMVANGVAKGALKIEVPR
jgi:hypothetical protein